MRPIVEEETVRALYSGEWNLDFIIFMALGSGGGCFRLDMYNLCSVSMAPSHSGFIFLGFVCL